MTAPSVSAPGVVAPSTRRGELAAFLRSRRERIAPADVGLAGGPRRRTPGLRREEVAQLSGVGVTWYTWLEQGRQINVSSSVLGAISRTLRLDGVERAHLMRLAGVATCENIPEGDIVDPDVQRMLDDFATLPASVTNARMDVLAWNETYARLFPTVVTRPAPERNMLWVLFTTPRCCNPFENWTLESENAVGRLRGAYAGHIGDPAWTDFVERLCEASPPFAQAWNSHPVSRTYPAVKHIRNPEVGTVRVRPVSAELLAAPGQKFGSYLPADDESRERLLRLYDADSPLARVHVH